MTATAEPTSATTLGPGLCTCPSPRVDWENCFCPWGVATKALVAMAYAVPDNLDVVEAYQGRLAIITRMMAEQYRAVLQREADAWTGTRAAFAFRIGLSRQRLDQLGVRFRS